MEQTTVSWLCLLGAGVCQAAWTYSLKFMQVATIKTIRWHTFFKPDGGLLVIAPWIGYILFGAVNSILLAVAMRTIAMSTAFAVWMASSLILIKLIDIVWLKQGWSYAELFFTLLITVGIVGLKMSLSK